MHKFLLCLRLRLCCNRLLRRPCRPFLYRGAHFVSDPTSPRRRCRQSLRPPWNMLSIVRSLFHRPSLTTGPDRAKAAPTYRSSSPPEVSSERSIDPVPAVTIQQATDAATPAPTLAWCTPSRCTSARQHPSRSPRDALTGGNRFHVVCRATLAHRLGSWTTCRTGL